MGKKVIRLTESDLTRIVKRVIDEQRVQLTPDDIYDIQDALREYFKMKKKNIQVPVNGKWDDKTKQALKIFQDNEGVDVDGIPGKDTYEAFHKLGLHQDLLDKLINMVGSIFN